MSEGEGKAEMAAKCFSMGEQPEVERRLPRNSILETTNSHLGRPIMRFMFPTEA